MFDQFNRKIHYLRFSITDRCNLRCRYCMPDEGLAPLGQEKLLTVQNWEDIAREGVRLGCDKIRLTGGEPLVSEHVEELVKRLAHIEGLKDLALTTNGTLLAKFAGSLKELGLHRLNISLDTVDPKRYRGITQGGCVADVLRGIQAAKAAGFTQIKLNCVVENGPDEPDALGVAGFAKKEALEVRYIRRMELSSGRFSQVIGGSGGHCGSCNRLRITSDGWVYPCLFSDLRWSIHELGIVQALELAVAGKPAAGKIATDTEKTFNRIGG